MDLRCAVLVKIQRIQIPDFLKKSGIFLEKSHKATSAFPKTSTYKVLPL
ncbi:hypothetical protein COO91_03159 [Nostoc flagelliforme CCNUN1]|uniref:Uncharacterized protein n=1 Tax=Nostoc flagelliforme CCNUN1 TaxID=2038116 RepID=A0A2K8SP74_9NOSO|nr:hypothetical protein COO91_03159 [Nostoc flagelliforme CCNUN1]